MTEMIDPTVDQITTTPQNQMQNNDDDDDDGDEDTNSLSGDSDSSGCSIDESFSFSHSYARTFDAENESISLLNLSISPISANHDDELVKDIFERSDQLPYSGTDGADDDDDDDERISLDEITAQINTPPSLHSKSATKRLNLETIFEGVFLETPPKKRKFEMWRIRTTATIDERISTYVKEQQQSVESSGNSTDSLCNLFDERIDID